MKEIKILKSLLITFRTLLSFKLELAFECSIRHCLRTFSWTYLIEVNTEIPLKIYINRDAKFILMYWNY